MVNDEVTKVRVSGDGSTDTVDFDFKYLQESDIKVYKIDTSVTPEVATLQVLNTDYTVTAADPQGGTITFTTAPTVDEDAFVKLDAPYTQTVDIPSAGVFREEAIENGLDKTVLLCHQLREEIGRSIKLPETSSITSVSFDTPVDGRALKWRDDGSGNWTAESSASDPDDAAAYATAAAASAATASSAASSAQTAQGLAEDARDAAQLAAAQFTLAPQAEAEAGTDNTKYMSSLRVAQAITAQVSVGDRYVSRGNVSSFDFTPTRDSNFNDIDCSAIVPAGAKRIKFAMVISTTASSGSGNYYTMNLRKNGSTSTVCEASVTVQAITGTQQQFSAGEVECDSSRVIECQVDSSANMAYLAVVGWYV